MTDAAVGRDLSAFDRRLRWDERLSVIRREFPSTTMGVEGWVKAFDRDIDMLGSILRDVLKADQAEPGRPGPRPSLEATRAQPRFDEWMGKDPSDRPYTELPFTTALSLLKKEQSFTQVARKTGISRSHLHRLANGEFLPTLTQMEQIAKAYGKRPSYFVEYRIGVIVGAIAEGLAGSPHRSVPAYETLLGLQTG